MRTAKRGRRRPLRWVLVTPCLLVSLAIAMPATVHAFAWGLDLGVTGGAHLDDLGRVDFLAWPQLALRTGRADRSGIYFDAMVLPPTLGLRYAHVVSRTDRRCWFVTAGGGVGTLILSSTASIGPGVGLAVPSGSHRFWRFEVRYDPTYVSRSALSGPNDSGRWVHVLNLRAGLNF